MIDYGQVVAATATILGFVFPFWPLVVIAPLQQRRHVLYNMTLAWAVMGVLALISLSAKYHASFRLIPEPWNTVAYLATGLTLLTAQVGRKYGERRSIQGKADRAASVEDLHSLSPTQFENMVVELYSSLGHRARRTGAVGDHGHDVVVQAANGEKWVIQCKRWRGRVGEPVIRDFYGVMHHEKADRGAIITTGAFTDQAERWARGKPIELVEGREFLRLLKQARTIP